MAAALFLALSLALLPAPLPAQGPRETVQEPAPAPGDPTARLEAGLRDKLALWDPHEDDFVGEGQSQEAQEQLKHLIKALHPGKELAPADLVPLLHQDFAFLALRPAELAVVFEDDFFRVRRAAPVTEQGFDPSSDSEAFPEALTALLATFTADDRFAVKLKIFRALEKNGSLATQAYFFAEGTSATDGRLLQLRGIWTMDWRLDAERAPQLATLRVDDFEEVRGPAGGAPLYVDTTASMFGEDPAYEEQFLPGMVTWQGRLGRGLGFSDQSHQGVAIGDVDGDGLEDLFLPQPGGLPNRLYLHQPDGSLRDHSAAAGVDFLDATRSALLVDLDDDGDLDLVMGVGTRLAFLSNDGSGRFTVEVAGPAPEITSLAAADFDGDGWLDIYVCRYLNPYEDAAVPTPYHDANNGLDNLLLRGGPDWSYADVTAAVGLDENNRRFSFAASWEDFDDDGDQDLYVANDFGRNNLYRNDDGSFVDVAAEAGVEDISAGMGVAWGDMDRDGHMDLYVSNMDSSAGKRIAYQREFSPGAGEGMLGDLRRHARGNSLFRNRGDGSFEDVTLEREVHRGLWAWGSIFADLNNDARLDLVVPNGFATNDREDDL